MLMLQVATGASMDPQLCVAVNSPAFAPLSARVEIASPPFPVFVSFTREGALNVPASCVIKFAVAVESVTAGTKPVPESVTTCGLPAAESANESDAVRAPPASG